VSDGITIDDTLLDAQEKMDKAVSVAREDLATIRAGRVTPTIFAKVTVDYYGTPTPVNQLASFHQQEARTILLNPYDKGSLAGIERAIRDSDLGVNPSNDGERLRVVFPELTEQRRREYVKLARHKAEEARVAVRNIRRHAKEALDRLAHDGEVGEDEVARAEKELDKLTQRCVAGVDELLGHKEDELLEV